MNGFVSCDVRPFTDLSLCAFDRCNEPSISSPAQDDGPFVNLDRSVGLIHLVAGRL